jgi:hypothetical protein
MDVLAFLIMIFLALGIGRLVLAAIAIQRTHAKQLTIFGGSETGRKREVGWRKTARHPERLMLGFDATTGSRQDDGL